MKDSYNYDRVDLNEYFEDSVRNYISWISRFPAPITDIDELKIVFDKIREEDRLFQKENEKLVKCDFINRNLRLVIKFLGKYSNRGISDADLIQIGNLGLMKAVDKFDLSFGCKFSTYAFRCIETSIRNEILYHGDRVVSISANQRRLIAKVFNAKSEMMKELGRYPNNQELADKLKITVKEIQECYSLARDVLSLDEQIHISKNEEFDGETLYDFIPDERVDVFEEVSLLSLRNKLEILFERILSEKEIQILKYIFEFDNKYMSYGEIGEKYGISRQRIE